MEKLTKQCTQCGVMVERPPKRSDADFERRFKFCSARCRWDSMKGHTPWNKGVKYDEAMKARLNLSGLALGHSEEVNNRRKGKRNSPTTEFKKGYKQKKGSEHYNWKGGTRTLDKEIRQSTPYKEWRTAVFTRDDYTCQDCGIRGGNGKKVELNADHINMFSVILQKHGVDSVQRALICAELWDISNGRTLCVPCHKKTPTWGLNRKYVALNN